MLDVELYKEEFNRRKQLAKLVNKYYLEMHPNDYISDMDKCLRFVDIQYRSGKDIWTLLYKGKPIGYGIVGINNEYGMLPDSVEQEYMFIKKKHRKGSGAAMLLKIAIRACVHYGLNATAPTYIGGEANKVAKALGMKADIETVKLDKNIAKICLDRLSKIIDRRRDKDVTKKD